MGCDAVWSAVEHSPEAWLPGNVSKSSYSGLKRGNELSAGLFTAATGGCANPAMPVHFRVLFALLGAFLTDNSTYFELHLHNLRIGAGLAGNHAGCCAADIGTIKIHTDAVDQRLHLFLSEAGISTDIASVGAFNAGSDTVDKTLFID
ncbi:MAG: hypothetical protein A2X80_04205 [Geobacteraceae bacterium GWB2_52_12]|nr:MAG: hypothetical protein A2X80_04205 [Geobacteraceae bacterium GWB2_52_12]